MRHNKVITWRTFFTLFFVALIIYFLLIFLLMFFNNPTESCSLKGSFLCALYTASTFFFAPILFIKSINSGTDGWIGFEFVIWSTWTFWYGTAWLIGYCVYYVFFKKNDKKNSASSNRKIR